ncbi:MAG: hypothetical protein SWE60_10405 [Thermodesulfobacteriota bacterium]|nr:hypothetical protein [Thermodesulfobacteriota bacterium]MDY6990339.1 hypothetical protein [Thermodesulfobacteriota bacterium]
MKKATIGGTKSLKERLSCFGQYNPRDSICVQWCLFNIRCAIARNQDEEIETIEDLVELAVEPYGLQ